MVGTNDLKLDCISTDDHIRDLYKQYKTKISLIRQHNKNCKLFVCPVLPTRSLSINRKVFAFNRYIYDDLVRSNLKVSVVEGFQSFLDYQSNTLSSDTASTKSGDILHLNKRGTSILVVCIKRAIFGAKTKGGSRIGRRSYSNALRNGPLDPG